MSEGKQRYHKVTAYKQNKLWEKHLIFKKKKKKLLDFVKWFKADLNLPRHTGHWWCPTSLELWLTPAISVPPSKEKALDLKFHVGWPVSKKVHG